jgi:hypothetical protein
MSNTPNRSTRQEIEQEEETRRRFEADAISRQSNVLPMDAARNEGRFYGKLIRGERAPSGVQRIGFFLVGFLFCSWAIFIVITSFPRLFGFINPGVELISDNSTPKIYLPFAALALFLGLKVIVSAISPRKQKS